MAKKGSFSKVYDKNGDYVDVEAARFDGTRTFQMQGDVSATQTWNGDSASALTLNTSIGAKKVTTDKINDKAVQTGQIDDGAVGLTQIATNAMNGTVQDNDSKLATHAAVKTYVDSQISGQGTYLGKHTVAEINAMVTDNLHNGDRVMTSDSGTINLGPGGVGFDVEAGEDLILYKSGSTVQWDSMDGNFKTKQTAVSDPTASGTGLTFIDSITQDENGEITPSKKTVQDGTTSQKGVVQLEDSHTSTSTTKAATPNSVKEAYDLASTANSGLANKQDKPSSATENNIATFNGTKSTKDSGKSFLPSTSTWDGTSDDKVPTAKAVQALLDDKADFNKVVAIADSTYTRENENGNGWNKLASIQNNGTWRNNIGFFDLCYANLGAAVNKASLYVNVRWDSDRTAANILDAKVVFDNYNTAFNVAVVNRASSSSVITEIWAYLPKGNYSMSLSYRSGSTKIGSEAHSAAFTNNKDNWEFFSYVATSESKPVEDLANNVKVVDAARITNQHNVTSATAGNFAGLDANGLLTDSGKKAADFELVANKVTSVRAASSATDTAYPSEKAVATALDNLDDTRIPIGNKYDNVKVFESNTTPWKCYEISNIGLTDDNKTATAEFLVYSCGSSADNRNLSYKVNVHWTRTSVVLEVEGSDIQEVWTGVVVNSATPASTDVTTLKLYCTPTNSTTYRLSVASCKIIGGADVIEGTITKAATQETIPTASSLVIIGTTIIRTLVSTRDVSSTYSSTGTNPVNGKAVADALASYEQVSNKVSAWQTTPDNTHYPSEKLVKDGLDGKADADSVVAIADAYVLRRGQVGQGWYKLAETTTPHANYSINSVFDVVISSVGGESRCSFVMSVRYEGTGVVNFFTKSLFCDARFPDYPIKIVHTKVSSTVLKVELYFGVKPSITTNAVYSGISISEQNAGNYGGTNEKNTWTYTSYTDVAGSAEPESDPTSNKDVVDVDIVYRQHAIASPTNNNLVAMDANGLVKDSGLSATSIVTGPSSATADDIAVFDGATGKIVKDSGKKLSDIVKYYDANVYRYNSNSGDGWFKIAEKTITAINSNVVGVWRVVNTTIGGVNEYTLECNVRAGSSGSNLIKYKFRIDGCDSFVETVRTFKLVTRGKAGGSSSIVELWCYLAKDFVDVAISALHVGGLQTTNSASWTYYSGHGGGTSLPTADPSSDVNVYDLDFKISKQQQNAVTDPTASGTALSFIDSITQNENGEITATKKTVSDATTSEHGLMSAADKTKLNGIAEGAEANVQADWDETDSSADSFIKNKPYYEKSLGATGKIFKVFSSPKLTSGNKDCYGIELFYRAGYGGIYGNLLFKDVFILQQTKIGNVQAWQTLKFYVSVGTDTVTVYAKNDDGYCTLCAAPLANLPKAKVDFTDFGTEVSELPTGATEITPVWVANSASSSGTAPVKVDAYGGLTPVPMDSTPTASSTNLMTSGDIKTALDLKAPIASPALTGTPTAPTASSGTNTTQIATTAFVQSGLNGKLSAYTGNSYGVKFYIPYGMTSFDNNYAVFENARECIYEKVTVGLRVYCVSSSNPVGSNSSFHRTTSKILSADNGRGLTKMYYKTTENGVEVYVLHNMQLNGVVRTYTSDVRFIATVLTSSVDTSTMTALNWTNNLHEIVGDTNGSAIGSTSIPTYVDATGKLTACTDDFVHDAEIAKMVQLETAGTAVGSSLQPVYVDTSGIATPIDYKKWISERRDVLNALPSDWYKSEGSISIPSGNTVKYVELSGLNSIGGMDLWVMCNATNSPCMIRARFNLFRYGRSGIQILDRSGYDNANIGSIIIRTDSNAAGIPNFDNVKIYFRILNSSDVFAWRCSEARTNSHFAVLTEAQYNALTSVVACSANCTRFGATSTSSRHIQRGSYDVLDTGDVAQSYSSSSTAPISGKGVKAAVDNLSNTQIPIGLKYDMVLANETSTTPTLCYEISNIGLTSNYSAATAELVVYQYAALGTSYTNIPSYKVVVHWDRASAICIVEGLNPTGTWTAVVENSTTPSSTDVTTLKLYFKPAQYRTYRMSVVSCKLRGASRESYITDGTIVVKKVTQEIPTASTLVIVGTTTVKTLICDKNVTSTYSATGTDPVNGTAVASAISTKQDTLSFMSDTEAHSLWTNAKANAS